MELGEFLRDIVAMLVRGFEQYFLFYMFKMDQSVNSFKGYNAFFSDGRA